MTNLAFGGHFGFSLPTHLAHFEEMEVLWIMTQGWSLDISRKIQLSLFFFYVKLYSSWPQTYDGYSAIHTQDSHSTHLSLSFECGVWSAECGVQSVECGLIKQSHASVESCREVAPPITRFVRYFQQEVDDRSRRH